MQLFKVSCGHTWMHTIYPRGDAYASGSCHCLGPWALTNGTHLVLWPRVDIIKCTRWLRHPNRGDFSVTRLLFFGDIVGRTGRDLMVQELPKIKKDLAPDCVIVNAENAAAGFGLTKGICEELYGAGVDVISTGNHVWDNSDILNAFQSYDTVIRPANLSKKAPGKGFTVFTTPAGKKIVVINMLGRLFMDSLNDPFEKMEDLLQQFKLSSPEVDAIFVDFHAEATSEKQAFAAYFDGKISALVGTHTHVPTADARIFPGGTGYQTDAGMCGDYQSVIGMEFETSIPRFLKHGPSKRMQVASGNASLFGVQIDLDSQTGLTKKIIPLRYGSPL